MFGNSTTQEGNTAKNLAARDVNEHTYTLNLPPLQKHNKLKELFKAFEHEKANNIQFREFIDELELESLFHRNTFNEPLQQCRAQKWTE